MLQAIKKTLFRSPTIFEFFLAAALLAIPAAFFSTPEILIKEAGWSAIAAKLAWAAGIICINTFLWVCMVLTCTALKCRPSNLSLIIAFVISQIAGGFFIASNAVHYIVFNEHWNLFNVTTTIIGGLGGEAPVDVDTQPFFLLALAITLASLLGLLLVKFSPKFLSIPLSRHSSDDKALAPTAFVSWASLLVFAHTSCLWIPANWATRQIQEVVPIYNVILDEQKHSAHRFGLDTLEPNHEYKRELFASMKNAEIHVPTYKISKRPNILFLHIEGFRFDQLNEETTPNLYRFSQQKHSITLDQHFSSSNNTPSSIFSLVTGLDASYYQYFRENPSRPMPMQILEGLGYEMKLHHSGSITYQNMKSLFFDNFEAQRAGFPEHQDNDKASIDAYLQRILHTKPEAPQFTYIVFEGSHYPYWYPEDTHSKFKPALERNFKISSKSYNHMADMKKELFNRYRNSLFYVDSIIGHLLDELEANSKLDSTIIAIYGDHGEEFWENNRFGHSYSLVNEQVKVAALLHTPSQQPILKKYTAHHDFMPSIFAELGLDEYRHIFSGQSVYKKAEHDISKVAVGVVSSRKRYDYAVIGDGLKVTYNFNNELEIIKISDLNDTPLNYFSSSKVRNLILSAETNRLDLRKELSQR